MSPRAYESTLFASDDALGLGVQFFDRNILVPKREDAQKPHGEKVTFPFAPIRLRNVTLFNKRQKWPGKNV